MAPPLSSKGERGEESKGSRCRVECNNEWKMFLIRGKYNERTEWWNPSKIHKEVVCIDIGWFPQSKGAWLLGSFIVMQGVETVERAKALDFGVTTVIVRIADGDDGDLIDWRVRWSWVKGMIWARLSWERCAKAKVNECRDLCYKIELTTSV